MEFLLIMFLAPLPSLLARSSDPAPGIWQSKSEALNLECTRMSQARAHELYPGQVPEPPPRGEGPSTTDALVCTQRFVPLGERKARDEVILTSLSQTVGEITDVASALGGGDLNWHVDAFYPRPEVASKISVAARTNLAERGRKVSDRVPVLAAGDISVLGRMSPKDSYPLACARYFAEGSLGEKDAFLGIMIVDERETQLHAGVCLGGRWKWLQ
jgi:hypothetical protein